ncbi:MAG TPA: anti-sigma factor antagonist [Roseiflexaceae bacterium]|nr:anti-sigma factor antagonist [Roseiflexaceae bacterium]
METRTLPARLESLALISEFITDAAARVGMDEHAAWQVQLAVDEAATNIIQHGYDEGADGVIELSWRMEGQDFVVTLRDYGRSFNPEEVPTPDIHSPLEERQAGGLGIYLMTRLMDSVRFDFDEQRGNILMMTKRIGPPAPDVQVFDLSGRLDAVGTQQAIAQVNAAVTAGARYILLDLSGVTFMSSSGLRALLLVRKELMNHGGQLRLCCLQPHVQEVFTLTGFTQVFSIHHTREEALRAFGQSSP